MRVLACLSLHGVVLCAALMHALWNSLVKSAGDKFFSSAVVAIWCGGIGLSAALILPQPAGAAMPFIVVSAIIHIVYFILVGQLYRSADLSVAYPIMRGLAPLIAAIIAVATLGEAPGPIASLGVAALVAGVLGMQEGRKVVTVTLDEHTIQVHHAGHLLVTTPRTSTDVVTHRRAHNQ